MKKSLMFVSVFADMEKESTALKEHLAGMAHKMKAMGQEHRSQLEQISERPTSLEAIIKRPLQ